MRAWDDNKASDEALDEMLTRALERAPTVVVPADFTRRIMQNLPRQRWASSARTFNYGKKAALGAMVLLALALIATLFAQPQNLFLSYGVVPLIALQLGALIFWLTTRQHHWR